MNVRVFGRVVRLRVLEHSDVFILTRLYWLVMKTLWHGKGFHIPGPLWEPIARWVPSWSAGDVEIWCFLRSSPEKGIKQIIALPVTCDVIMRMWRYYAPPHTLCIYNIHLIFWCAVSHAMWSWESSLVNCKWNHQDIIKWGLHSTPYGVSEITQFHHL